MDEQIAAGLREAVVKGADPDAAKIGTNGLLPPTRMSDATDVALSRPWSPLEVHLHKGDVFGEVRGDVLGGALVLDDVHAGR